MGDEKEPPVGCGAAVYIVPVHIFSAVNAVPLHCAAAVELAEENTGARPCGVAHDDTRGAEEGITAGHLGCGLPMIRVRPYQYGIPHQIPGSIELDGDAVVLPGAKAVGIASVNKIQAKRAL